jgi:succinate-semialdehyde dehydrogenase/glutarate-semialdehyde dehydrogenase
VPPSTPEPPPSPAAHRWTGPATSTSPPSSAGVPNDAAILGQEIFGPVAPVTTFTTEEDAIRLANASEYGLASYLYSRDFNRLLRVAEQIEFGMVGFNAGVISNAAAPFGGVKQSGLGREGGTEGIAEYTTTQYIGIADPYANCGVHDASNRSGEWWNAMAITR